MNGKLYTHSLLLLAMLFGQMVTNAHMINHMSAALSNCNPSVHHSHKHYPDLSALDTSSADSETDCSIYHAYAGANGVAPADRHNAALQSKSVSLKQPLYAQLPRHTATAEPIRGPPHVS